LIAIIIHLLGLGLLGFSLWFAIRVRKTGSPIVFGPKYLVPISTVLLGMCFELAILVAVTEMGLLRVGVGALTLLVFAGVMYIAITDPEVESLSPWYRDPL
jgi:hypothetical protein